MLVEFKKDGNVYKGVCTCGEVFYVIKPKKYVRCKNCLLKNKEVKKNKLEVKDTQRLLKNIVFKLCKRESEYE